MLGSVLLYSFFTEGVGLLIGHYWCLLLLLVRVVGGDVTMTQMDDCSQVVLLFNKPPL